MLWKNYIATYVTNVRPTESKQLLLYPGDGRQPRWQRFFCLMKTSRHYFDRYQKGDTEALLDDNYSGAEPKLNEHQISELDAYLEGHVRS